MTAPCPPSNAQMWRHYWLKDHGILRAVWTNFHKLDADIWRHNHPSPARLAQLQALGAKSVLSLRGDGSIPSVLEARACEDLGLVHQTLALRALALPQPQMLLDLLKAIHDMPKPLVIHCKSGSDRTGLAATLYLHVFKGAPLQEARKQLGIRYIHNPWGRAGVVSLLLDAYGNAQAATGIGFEDWVRQEYNPDDLMSKRKRGPRRDPA